MRYSSIEQAADEIIRRTQGRVVLGIPLGLGKPNQLVNTLYRKIKSQPQHSLVIYTALSLARPRPRQELERRFLQPFIERVWGDYEELLYLEDRRRGTLPANIQVREFFMQPGVELGNPLAQQNYLSCNYTHVAFALNDLGVNVVAQLVAEEAGQVSLSCNPEVTLDLLPLLRERRQRGEVILTVGQVHHALPFMPHSAVLKEEMDILVDDASAQCKLMSTPNMPVGMAEHFIGLNASALVKDGGTLQIGIGALGDAITHALILRDQHNASYQQLLQDSELAAQAAPLIAEVGGLDAFEEGLYGCSEMLTYGLLRLFQEYIIRRRVRDTRHGNAADICLHGGFFLGPQVFYDVLNQLSPAQKQQIDMAPISFINHLYGDEVMKREHRQQARFINTAFTITLLGAVVSDQLEDGRVLSGVGGQYNFVAQAHELDGARSIILLRATRDTAQGVLSNLVWSYGHCTVPRHLRDMVVTEYGIADLRHKTDSEVIAALLNIADSRFQPQLLAQAKAHGKIAANYQIPAMYLQNRPERLQVIYQRYRAQLPDFPLGCDFTDSEQQLLKALAWLKGRTKMQLVEAAVTSLCLPAAPYQAALERMQLAAPRTMKEKLYQRLLIAALRASA